MLIVWILFLVSLFVQRREVASESLHSMGCSHQRPGLVWTSHDLRSLRIIRRGRSNTCNYAKSHQRARCMLGLPDLSRSLTAICVDVCIDHRIDFHNLMFHYANTITQKPTSQERNMFDTCFTMCHVNVVSSPVSPNYRACLLYQVWLTKLPWHLASDVQAGRRVPQSSGSLLTLT